MRDHQLNFVEAVLNPALSRPSENKLYNIYYNNFLCSHTKALKEIYNIIYKLIGLECFENICQIYVPQNLSYSYKLQDYGKNFGSFLQNFTPLQNLPYLADLAQLEWAIHELYFSSENRVDNTKFVQSNYPILSIWEFCRKPEDKILDIQNKPGEIIMLKKRGLEIIFIRADLR